MRRTVRLMAMAATRRLRRRRLAHFAAAALLVAAVVAVGTAVPSAVRDAAAAVGRPGGDVVGAWFVSAPDAPFSRHMFVFHADGTMEQSNPDAGDTDTSDSAGFGQWSSPRSGEVTGRFGEVKATRGSGAYAGSGVVSYTLRVHGDRFTGQASAEFFDAAGRHVAGPLVTALSGERVAGDGPR